MEYEAFGDLEVLQGTSIDKDGSVLFRLYNLLMPPSTPDVFVVLYQVPSPRLLA